MNTTPWPESSTPANQTSKAAGELTAAQERSVRLALALGQTRSELIRTQIVINGTLCKHPHDVQCAVVITGSDPCNCWKAALEAVGAPGVLTDGSDLLGAPGVVSVPNGGGVA